MLSWLGHQSRFDNADAAVWRYWPAGVPITGHWAVASLVVAVATVCLSFGDCAMARLPAVPVMAAIAKTRVSRVRILMSSPVSWTSRCGEYHLYSSMVGLCGDSTNAFQRYLPCVECIVKFSRELPGP